MINGVLIKPMLALLKNAKKEQEENQICMKKEQENTRINKQSANASDPIKSFSSIVKITVNEFG